MPMVTRNLYFACGPLLFYPLKNGTFLWLINVYGRTVKKQSVIREVFFDINSPI